MSPWAIPSVGADGRRKRIRTYFPEGIVSLQLVAMEILVGFPEHFNHCPVAVWRVRVENNVCGIFGDRIWLGSEAFAPYCFTKRVLVGNIIYMIAGGISMDVGRSGIESWGERASNQFRVVPCLACFRRRGGLSVGGGVLSGRFAWGSAKEEVHASSASPCHAVHNRCSCVDCSGLQREPSSTR